MLNTNVQNNIITKRETITKHKYPNKCAFNGCNKKLSITSIRCKCDNIFCNSHTFYTEHNCTYDFKGEYKKELMNKHNNIKISKVEKI